MSTVLPFRVTSARYIRLVLENKVGASLGTNIDRRTQLLSAMCLAWEDALAAKRGLDAFRHLEQLRTLALEFDTADCVIGAKRPPLAELWDLGEYRRTGARVAPLPANERRTFRPRRCCGICFAPGHDRRTCTHRERAS